MSVAVLFGFLLGGGCLLLGAFFLWWRPGCSWWWGGGICLAAIVAVVSWALCCGQREWVAKLILGIVASNVALSSGIGIITGKSLMQECDKAWGWLVIGLLGCLWVVGDGQIGKFTGLGLVVVGLVTLWYGSRRFVPAKNKVDVFCQTLWWINIILLTLGLGLSALITGGLYLAQSVVTVVLPWLVGMVLVGVIASWLPKKTVRLWNGFVVVLYLVMLWFLR